MLSKTLWVCNLAEPITNIFIHFNNSINSVKYPIVILLEFLITVV